MFWKVGEKGHLIKESRESRGGAVVRGEAGPAWEALRQWHTTLSTLSGAWLVRASERIYLL